MMALAGFLLRNNFFTFLLLAGLVLTTRILAIHFINLPLSSDELGYMDMATNLAERNEINHAFLSAGYPIFLSLFFKLFGSSQSVAQGVNTGLGLVTLWLIWRCAKLVVKPEWGPPLASAAYVFYLPATIYTTYILKENLTAPILLGQILLLMTFEQAKSKSLAAIILGALYAATLITSPSAVAFGVINFAVILGVFVKSSLDWRRGVLFIVATILFLAPWLYHTNSVMGRPVLDTNTGFNLYIGHNSRATGYFTSIQDTDLGGETWKELTARYSYLERSDYMKDLAIKYMLDHPVRTVLISLKKAGLFWMPPIHEGPGGNQSVLESIVRKGWLIQYLIIMSLSFVPLLFWRQLNREIILIYACVTGFWILHAAVYIIFRYREPIMPFMILLACVGFNNFLSIRKPDS